MLARTVDSVKFAPPTTTGPLPFCKPVVTPLLSTQPDATSTALLRSRSTAAFIFTRSSVVSFAETAFSAGSSAGLACAAAAFTAGTTLSAFCRCLSSSRATSLSPATGAQALPAAPPDGDLAPRPRRAGTAARRAAPAGAAATAGARGAGLAAAGDERRGEEQWGNDPSVRAHLARLLCPVRREAPRRVSGGRIPAPVIEPLFPRPAQSGSVIGPAQSGTPQPWGRLRP